MPSFATTPADQSVNLPQPADWQDRQFCQNYQREYAQHRKRFFVNPTPEEYHLFQTFFEKQNTQNSDKTLWRFIKNLALRQLLSDWDLPQPIINQDDARKMIMLIRSCSNSLNQTARHLNSQIKNRKIKDKTSSITKNQSKTVLEHCFSTLQNLEQQLRTYFDQANTASKYEK